LAAAIASKDTIAIAASSFRIARMNNATLAS